MLRIDSTQALVSKVLAQNLPCGRSQGAGLRIPRIISFVQVLVLTLLAQKLNGCCPDGRFYEALIMKYQESASSGLCF